MASESRAVGASSAAEARRRRTPPAGRAPGRRTILIGVAALIVVVAIVVALTSMGGSGAKNAKTSQASTVVSVGSTHTATPKKKSSSKASAPTTNPAETIVTVLNGTEKPGLAHRVSGQLQQSGYSQANALNGHPAGANATTVVEYAGGHQADAEGVARSLSIKQVQPLESAVAPLAGPAKVVVIVGADTAAKVP